MIFLFLKQYVIVCPLLAAGRFIDRDSSFSCVQIISCREQQAQAHGIFLRTWNGKKTKQKEKLKKALRWKNVENGSVPAKKRFCFSKSGKANVCLMRRKQHQRGHTVALVLVYFPSSACVCMCLFLFLFFHRGWQLSTQDFQGFVICTVLCRL